MTKNPRDTALITGASSGIGAIAADRLAKRGHDLILVARNRERLEDLAERLCSETGRSVEVIVADLNERADLTRVEEVLRNDASITALVNNAGVGAPTPFLDAEVERLERMIELNVTALVRLTYAALPGFLKRGGGAIINIASVLGIVPELLSGVYGGTKAFVLRSAAHSTRNLRRKTSAFKWFFQVQQPLASGISLELRFSKFRAKWL